MASGLGLGYRYLRKFGARRFVAAALMAMSRRLSSEVSVTEADRVLGLGQREGQASQFPLERFDFSPDMLVASKRLSEKWLQSRNRKVESVHWFVPDYYHPYIGGVFTIFRFIDFLTRRSVLNRLILIENPIHKDPSRIRDELASIFPALGKLEVLIMPDDVPASDVSIATRWDTAYPVLKQTNTNAKYYFIQDYEPLFYPAGIEYGLAEATYRFGFIGLTNGPWLAEMYENRYGGQAVHFTPSVDRNLFHPASSGPRSSVKQLFFYARPRIRRNAFDLGVAVIAKIKQAHSGLKVHFAGDDLTGFRIPFEHESHGILSLAETAELYRACDVGICFTWSEHPSYIPLELLASGCAVISNKNPAFNWLLKDNENSLLTEPTPSAVAAAFEELYNQSALRERFFANGLETVSRSSWEQEMEQVHRKILGEEER